MEYYNYNRDTKIKPKLLARMPLKVSECGYKHIDTFINMSPGLIEVQQSNNLIVVIRPTSVMFFTDSDDSHRRFREAWTHNMAIANPIHFADKIVELDKTSPVSRSQYPYAKEKKISRMQNLLDQLNEKHSTGIDLKSIRDSLYKKRKKDKDESDER